MKGLSNIRIRPLRGWHFYRFALLSLAWLGLLLPASAARTVSGVVVTDRNEVVPGVRVIAEYGAGTADTITDSSGSFQLSVPEQSLTLRVAAKYVVSEPRHIGASDSSENLLLQVGYAIAPVQESMVITATALNPTLDQRNGNVYKKTLFSRDDQIHLLPEGSRQRR